MFFHLGYFFFILSQLLHWRGWSNKYFPGLGNAGSCAVMLYVGERPRGSNGACSTLCWFSVTPSATHNQIGPLWCWFPSGWACALSRPLWVSPMNSPVRLGVSPASSTLTGFFIQRFWGFISPCWNPGLCGLSRSPFVPPGLSSCKCGTTWSTSHCFAVSPLHPSCLCPIVLPVWMNVSSLTPWFLDFHIVWFSGSSGCFSVFKFVVVLLLVVRGGTKCLPMPPSWLEVSLGPFLIGLFAFWCYIVLNFNVSGYILFAF